MGGGFGMVVIEAQASGLPVAASTNIPDIVKVTDNIEFLDLDDEIINWKDQILSLGKDNKEKRGTKYDCRINQYDLSHNINKLIKVYNKFYI